MFETYITDEVKPWRELLLVHKFAVDELKTKLTILDEEFRLIHDYNPIEHVRYRVKKKSSIIEKLERMGHPPTVKAAKQHIFDIAGIRIICAFTADIYKVVDMLEKQHDLKIIKIKDYIQNPKSNGYKSLHLHIEYPVFLSSGIAPTRVEIQLRTIAMDFWASIEHKLYYKYRELAPDGIQDQLKECASLISQLDDRMYHLKKQIHALDDESLLTKSYQFYRDEDNF